MITGRALRAGGIKLSLVGALLLGCLPGMALDGQATVGELRWELSAERVQHQREPERIIAEGEVALSRPEDQGEPLVIRADWMSYDPERGVVEAKGRVRIETTAKNTAATAAFLHLESQSGFLEQATIHLIDRELYIKGARIEKTGAETYSLLDAWLSACRPLVACHPDEQKSQPAWSFKSQRVEITLDGMAHLYHPRFQIKEVPVIYLPHLLLPAKITRQSGFLFPEWSLSSRDGFGLNLPYFINLSPSADLTLYPHYLSNRGLLAGAEFRYVTTASRGMLMGSFLRDRHLDSDREDFRDDKLLRDTSNRYWLRGKADHNFGEGLVLRFDLDLVSDQDFIQEFDTGSQGYRRNNQAFREMFGRDLLSPSLDTRQSFLQLTNTTPQTLLAGEFLVQQDSRHRLELLPGHNADGVLGPGESRWRNLGPSPPQALPRLISSGRVPIKNPPLSFPLPLSLAWEGEYVHYWRSRGIGAHRLDLHPRLITPMPRSRGWTEGQLAVGARQTMYQIKSHGEGYRWEHDSFQDRTAFDLEANLATTLVRSFDLAALPRFRPLAQPSGNEAWLEHMVRPNLIYQYTTRSAEDRLPQLDSVDRLMAKNWLTYELNNHFRLTGFKPQDASEKPGGNLGGRVFHSRSLALFRISQTYDLAEARRDNLQPTESRREFSDLRLDLQANPLPHFNFRYQTNLSMYGEGLTRHELQGHYAAPTGLQLGLNYRFLKYRAMVEPFFYTTKGAQLHDVSAQFSSPLGGMLTLRSLIRHSFSDDHLAEASLGLTYKPHCWALDLEARRHLDEKSIMVVFRLDSIDQAFSWLKGGL